MFLNGSKDVAPSAAIASPQAIAVAIALIAVAETIPNERAASVSA